MCIHKNQSMTAFSQASPKLGKERKHGLWFMSIIPRTVNLKIRKKLSVVITG